MSASAFWSPLGSVCGGSLDGSLSASTRAIWNMALLPVPDGRGDGEGCGAGEGLSAGGAICAAIGTPEAQPSTSQMNRMEQLRPDLIVLSLLRVPSGSASTRSGFLPVSRNRSAPGVAPAPRRPEPERVAPDRSPEGAHRQPSPL